MSLLPQRGQDEEANEYLDRILPELNEILENSLNGTAFVKNGKVFVRVVSPHNPSDKDLQIGNMLTNATKIVTIDTEKLEDAAVTLAKVANGSINGDKLVTSEAVITQSAQIGDGTILTAAIGNAQITNAKVNDLAANKITSGTLAADRIGADSITSGKIAADAITTDKIAANAITASEIATDAVTTAKLAANSITSAKLSTSTLITQAAQIQDAVITSAKIASINADTITAGDLNADRIKGGTLTIGNVNVSGVLNAANISDAVITQIKGGTVALSNSSGFSVSNSMSTIGFPFNATNDSNFNTKYIAILHIVGVNVSYADNDDQSTSGHGITLSHSGVSNIATSVSVSGRAERKTNTVIGLSSSTLTKGGSISCTLNVTNLGTGTANVLVIEFKS